MTQLLGKTASLFPGPRNGCRPANVADTTRMSTQTKPALAAHPKSCFDSAERLLSVFRPDLTNSQRKQVHAHIKKYKLSESTALALADKLSRAAPIYAVDTRAAPVLTLDVAFWAKRRPTAALDALVLNGWVITTLNDPEVLPGFFILHLRANQAASLDMTKQFGWRQSTSLFDGAISVITKKSHAKQLAFT